MILILCSIQQNSDPCPDHLYSYTEENSQDKKSNVQIGNTCLFVILCNTAAFQHFIHSPDFPPSLCSYFTSILFLADEPQKKKKKLNKSCCKWEKQEKVYFEVLKDFGWLFVSRRLQFQAQVRIFEAADSRTSEEAGR